MKIKKEIKEKIKNTLIISILLGGLVYLFTRPSDYDVCINNGTDAKICDELIDNQ